MNRQLERTARGIAAAAVVSAGSAGPAFAADASYTYQRSDGNRVIAGTGPGASARAVDVPLPGRPAWVLAVPGSGDVLWLIALEDGRLVRVRVSADGAVGAARTMTERLPAGAPPAAAWRGSQIALLERGTGASALSHPVIAANGATVAIGADGDVRIGARTVPEIAALADARIALAGKHAVVLGQPTETYAHAVLGDATEAGAALVLGVDRAAVLARVVPAKGRVIEGLAPILADLDGDGAPEIILTESGPEDGARLAAYRLDGRLTGASEAIGSGYRWRHQIAVGATRPGGAPELVSVRTPHIGGVAEFHRLQSGRLVLVARHRGVSSHGIGSRNLDAAALADWDADGGLDLLAPSVAHDALVVVERTAEGAQEQVRLEAGGRIVTNVSGAALRGNALHVGVGTADGRLRMWGVLYTIPE